MLGIPGKRKVWGSWFPLVTIVEERRWKWIRNFVVPFFSEKPMKSPRPELFTEWKKRRQHALGWSLEAADSPNLKQLPHICNNFWPIPAKMLLDFTKNSGKGRFKRHEFSEKLSWPKKSWFKLPGLSFPRTTKPCDIFCQRHSWVIWLSLHDQKSYCVV